MQQVLIHQILLKEDDLATLKTDVDNLDIDKLEKVPSDLTTLKSKVNKLYVDKVAPVPVDLSMVIVAVKNNVVKMTEYDELVKNVNAIDTSGFVKRTQNDSKINEIKGELSWPSYYFYS